MAAHLGGRLGGRPPKPKEPVKTPLTLFDIPPHVERLRQVREWFKEGYGLEELSMLAYWQSEMHPDPKESRLWSQQAGELLGKIKEAESAEKAQPLVVVLERYGESESQETPPAEDPA
jgi:hypothetical protein